MNAARYTKPNLSFPICDTEATQATTWCELLTVQAPA